MKNIEKNIYDLSSGIFWAFTYEDSENWLKRRYLKSDYTKAQAKRLFKKELKELFEIGCGFVMSY